MLMTSALPVERPAIAGRLSARSQPRNAVFTILWQSACVTPPGGAVTALQAAASIWGARLHAPLEIHVSACWTASPPCTGLACGKTVSYLVNSPNAPQVDTAYPVALANALAGQDLNGSQHEISIWFDSDISWSFAVDPPGDFLIAALHEFGHGLGFESGLYESYNIGFCGDGPYGALYACPTVFDRAVVDALGVPLLSYKSPDPRVLGTKLKSDANFGGPNTRANNAGSAVELYTPATFDQGSSISHLGLSYIGGVDGLMTPNAGLASGAAPVGPLTLQIFRDLGWPLAGGIPNLSTSGPLALGLNQVEPFNAQLDWSAYAGQVLTYTWAVDDAPPSLHTGASLTDQLALSWSDTGLHTLVVTAAGPFGSAAATRSLLIFDLSLSGPAVCPVGNACTYGASLSPDTTYLPVSYLWQASEQLEVVHTDIGTSDSVGYTWNTSGLKTITVTATLSGQPIQALHHVQVSGGEPLDRLYLPMLMR